MNARYCWILGLSLLVAVGCQHKPTIESNRTAVKGTVTLDGKPLPCGCITFLSVENPMFRVSAMIRPDGSFSVADAPLGKVNVTVETETARGNNPNYVPIPKRYGIAKTSDLTATVTKDDAFLLSFALQSK